MTNEIINTEDNLPVISDDKIIQLAQTAEKRIEAIKKIKTIALKVTNPNDWIDQQGRPYLQASGSTKVARVFGVSWRIDEPTYEEFEDGHFQYSFKGEFSLAGATIESLGVRSSKDGFFTTRYIDGKKIHLTGAEVDKGDVKKAALTNLLGNGVTTMLGIRNLTWDEISNAMNFGKEDVTKIQYKKKDTRPPLRPPQKSPQKPKKPSGSQNSDNPISDVGEKTWPSKQAFIADIKDYEERIGSDVYADILSAYEVNPGELHKVNKKQGLALYNELERAYKKVRETIE